MSDFNTTLINLSSYSGNCLLIASFFTDTVLLHLILMVKITVDKIITDYKFENKQEDSSFLTNTITFKYTTIAIKLNCI